MEIDDKESFLISRLAATADSQRRGRLALLLSTIVAATILAGEWNSYFSWDRQWATWARPPANWVQQEVLKQEIKSWVETNTVGVSVLGLRLSVSDAAVVGSIALLIAAFYVCMSLRRENEEIGSLFTDLKLAPRQQRYHAFVRLRGAMVLSAAIGNDAPYTSLESPSGPKVTIPFADSVLKCLMFLPATTVLVIIVSDLYFTFLDFSPQRQNSVAAWYGLAWRYKVQLVAMDLFAVLVALLIMTFCRFAWRYHVSTGKVIAEFARSLSANTPSD